MPSRDANTGSIRPFAALDSRKALVAAVEPMGWQQNEGNRRCREAQMLIGASHLLRRSGEGFVILIHGSVPRCHCLLGQATFVFFTDVHAGPLESIDQRGVGLYFCHGGDEDRPDFGISRLRTTMVLRGRHDTISVLQSWEIRNRVQRSYGPAKTPRAWPQSGDRLGGSGQCGPRENRIRSLFNRS